MNVNYTRSGAAHLAYDVRGEGPALLALSALTLSIDALDDEPHSRRYHDRLRSFTKLVQFDVRGVGLSDPIDPGMAPTFAATAADAFAVLDAAGCDRAFVLGAGGSGPVALHCAVAAPERVSGLILIDTYCRLTRTDGYSIGYSQRVVDAFVQNNIDPNSTWESPVGDDDVALIVPSLSGDPQFRAWWTRAGRQAASPSAAMARLATNVRADCRDLLPLISVPTLVMHRRDDRFVPHELGEYLAEHIPNAKFVTLPGADNVPWGADSDVVLDEIELFITGTLQHAIGERVLATVLFTDIVDSTVRAVEMGDRQWRELLDTHDTLVREQLRRFSGREVNTTGDGFVAAFESPTMALRAAQAIVDTSARAGISIRAGLHTGECERRGDDLAGLAVHIAARVGALAPAGRVLVTRTVRDLVVGTDVRFDDYGEHQLKGVPDPWQLFVVA